MQKYLVVIDTNVLVSSLLSKHNNSSTVQILELVFLSKIIPLFNNEIINEYKGVLYRKKFNFNPKLINKLLKFIYANGIMSERLHTNTNLIDSNDLAFYEVCMKKRNDGAMLVTGNIKHFPKENFIVTPKELIELINK